MDFKQKTKPIWNKDHVTLSLLQFCRLPQNSYFIKEGDELFKYSQLDLKQGEYNMLNYKSRWLLMHSNQFQSSLKLSNKLLQAKKDDVLLSAMPVNGETRDALSNRATWITAEADITLDISGATTKPVYYTFQNSEMYLSTAAIYIITAHGVVLRFRNKYAFIDTIIPAKNRMAKQANRKVNNITKIGINFDDNGKPLTITIGKVNDKVIHGYSINTEGDRKNG